ncbi:MAG: lactate racemase domain-containing protein [Chloroflexota bacterium]
MRVAFPGLAYSPVEIPESCLLGNYGPATLRSRETVERQLAVSLARPLGSEPLDSRLRPGMRVLLIVGDRTSAAPTARLLPALLDAIQAAGVARADVDLLVATASRCPMTSEELRHKLGPTIVDGFPVAQHQWRDWSQLRRLGPTTGGYPVVVNRKVVEADFVIALHAVVPDRVGGYSGGYEVIAPGCLGDTHSTLDVRWQAARYPANAILGVASNPVRQIIDEIGKIAGLDFVVQVVQDGRGETVDVVAGAPDVAYSASAGTALQIYGVDVPAPADVVVAVARPDEGNLFQAAKALYAASLAARPGGAVILVAECPEGVAPAHPEILQRRAGPVADIDRDLSLGKLTDVVSGAFLAMVSRAIAPLGLCYLVSSGVSEREAACLGFQSAPSPGNALARARQLIGPAATVLILRDATLVVPRT